MDILNVLTDILFGVGIVTMIGVVIFMALGMVRTIREHIKALRDSEKDQE